MPNTYQDLITDIQSKNPEIHQKLEGGQYFRWFSLIAQHKKVGLRAQNQAKHLRLAELYRFVVESSGSDSREPRKVKLKVAHPKMYFMWSRVPFGTINMYFMCHSAPLYKTG